MIIEPEVEIEKDESGIYYHEADAGCDAGQCPDERHCVNKGKSNYDPPYRDVENEHDPDEPYVNEAAAGQ
jgi:hypothetical protein